MLWVLKRGWLPILIVIALAIAGLTVSRIRGVFASEGPPVAPIEFANDPDPFDPKEVTYEVFGPAGARVDVHYVDLKGRPQKVIGAVLPWRLELSTTAPAASVSVVAQGTAPHLGCRILVDDEVRDERIVDGFNVQTYCIVKSA
ncbi:MmpS family transport accessory protein [[Mycobacterium] fortunisiensis]|uniref:MmpS family transport accessory protein n=1 Tax=[Mycobacterium] fortunisiensis TaxID=2600579 RepID=UPI001C2588A3|nr:MmpS family transport accessory protein [[Mycobacterium] fortunisiensis]